MWRGRISSEHPGDARRPDLTKPKLKRKICLALKTQVLYLKWFPIHSAHYSSLLPFKSLFFLLLFFLIFFLTYATKDETLQIKRGQRVVG